MPQNELETQIAADGKRYPIGTGPTQPKPVPAIVRVSGTPDQGEYVIAGPDGKAEWGSSGDGSGQSGGGVDTGGGYNGGLNV